MSKPRLLDLFAGAGGAAAGYARAGFEVVGVDIEPQPNFPFEFHQADAMTFPLDGFDAVHASPPCQAYSSLGSLYDRAKHPDLVEPTRERLVASGLPFVIENVVGGPLLSHPGLFGLHGFRLCGSAFGLGVRRHRLFETNMRFPAPPPCAHDTQLPRYRIYQHGRWFLSSVAHVFGSGGGKAVEHWGEAMGIDWMSNKEIAQAIPPAYACWIGKQLLQAPNPLDSPC